ncbi:hypothetical protein ACJRO7_018671 [Eucalyptus globulus]|uniref:VQ domain-containing protein n=1 Tax=Eucalyptus globulus TaxID=34317 RepID=A0ABD3KYS3_EUCGL
MDNSRNRQNDTLGVNKMGKNIRKSPLHQPNFANNNNNNNAAAANNNNHPNNAARQQPQPQVYNISKNDFRSIVQQLTGSPSQDPLPRPPNNPPKPQSMRLQKIRPPPLGPMNRPHMPPPAAIPAAPPPVPYNNSFARPPQYGQPSPTPMPPMEPRDPFMQNTTESPISAYMRYLQTSIFDNSPAGIQAPPHLLQQVPGQVQNHPPPAGLLHNPSVPPPRMSGPMPPMPNLPSPQMNGPALLPSPTSQYLLPSPNSYFNYLSPRSPYPLLSPGFQFPPPLTPNFSFSSATQTGILGPGPQPPPSPGLAFPLSPSAFFPSPRWRT